MKSHCFALLVHDRPDPLDLLKMALKELSIETYSVRNCEEAKRLIPQTQPQLVFTDTALPDGSWRDVIELAEKIGLPVNVIVVGTIEDVKFYLTALERGAFDFVLPPFELDALDFIVQSASQNTRIRRQAQALAAMA
ncbi:MAG TPA: response regulator [Terriglobia bacterium]|nr:response regulator [Terriglobia bacterium]